MSDLSAIRRLLEQGERDAQLLDARDFDPKPWAEAYALLDAIERVEERTLSPWLAAILAVVKDGGGAK
jgi:hypothetical protein